MKDNRTKDGRGGRKTNSSVHYVLAEYPTAGAAMFRVINERFPSSCPSMHPCTPLPDPKGWEQKRTFVLSLLRIKSLYGGKKGN
jgi:hypothetical protein